MNRPNVRESRPPAQAASAHGPPARGPTRRWLPPAIALLLFLLVLLSLRPPTDGGRGDQPRQTRAGTAQQELGDGAGAASQDLGGTTVGHTDDAGGRDATTQGDPDLAGHHGTYAAATSPDDQPGNATQPSAAPLEPATAAPNAAGALTPTGRGNALPALGFSTDLTANPPATHDDTPQPQGGVAAPRGVSEGGEGTPGLASFFGAEGHGTKFVYILDKSGSMSGAPFESAKAELVRSLRALSPHEFFFVAFYDGHAEFMPGGRLVPATPPNIERAVAWVRSVSLGGSTDPTEALVYALDKLRPDTIWLLSDGAFSAEVVQTIADRNRAGRTHVNTLAFINRAGEALLKVIADQNRGDYRFVPGP